MPGSGRAVTGILRAMTDYVDKADTGHINFSPTGFRLLAQDFLQCYSDFKPARFSVLPFFLCCRAIELALKSMHLEKEPQAQVKQRFRHDLLAAYETLPPVSKTLSAEERTVLAKASSIYKDKRFEYVQASDAGAAYTRFPELEVLAQVAQKLAAGAA